LNACLYAIILDCANTMGWKRKLFNWATIKPAKLLFFPNIRHKNFT